MVPVCYALSLSTDIFSLPGELSNPVRISHFNYAFFSFWNPVLIFSHASSLSSPVLLLLLERDFIYRLHLVQSPYFKPNPYFWFSDGRDLMPTGGNTVSLHAYCITTFNNGNSQTLFHSGVCKTRSKNHLSGALSLSSPNPL